jgi:hypothetical protein
MNQYTDYSSPSGRYVVNTTKLETRPGCWNYLEHEVVDNSTGLVVARSNRNYSSSLLLFVEDYLGTDWLIVSENYHGGYGAIDLRSGKKFIHDPRKVKWYFGGKLAQRTVGRLARKHGYKLGGFYKNRQDFYKGRLFKALMKVKHHLGVAEYWCWAGPLSFNADTKTLEVHGCYWAAPFDIVTFDFSNPRKLPWKDLEWKDEPYEEDEEDDV